MLDFRSRLAFFLLYSAVVVSFGLLLFFLFNSKFVTAAIAIGCVVLLLTGLRIAVFGGTSDNKVRLRIASGSTALLFAALQLKSTALQLAAPFLQKSANELNIPISESTFDVSSPLDYLLALTIIVAWVIICYFMLRTLGVSPMGQPSEALSEILIEPTTKQRIQSLKANLRNKLELVNTQTQWSDTNYVPLEAEVQILEGKTARRKVVDLLQAIKMNPKTGLFVVLGEPGTGKSVALRTLASELLGQSRAKDRLPIYINLKEWKTEKVWTPENKPTVEDFHEFVFHSLSQEMDLPSQAFLKKNFVVLLEKGFLFFIFDSFDEIPAVLDHNEDSWIIGELSNCISAYVLNSRGVIASRLFRQPKLSHRERTVLEIQPFSDDRIVKAIKIASNEPDKLIRIILSERIDLGAIARNPFLLHLIIFHFNETSNPPNSQAEMFQTFIDSNIASAKRTLGVWEHSTEDIYRTCEDISAAMFEKPRGGLEIGELELRDQLDLGNLSFVLRFLVSARIGRTAPVSGAFSFSHRRFNEYFLVRRLRSKRTEIPFDAIQTDSRWRDALVLYAEIADNSDAKDLISHAWKNAARLASLSLGTQRSEFVASRNALRFIVEGFRNRPGIVTPYRDTLFEIISEKVSHSETDYIETKTVLEAIGLLDVERVTTMILNTLRRYPGWISEQAVTAARYLPTVEADLAVGIYRHCINRAGYAGFAEAKRQLNILTVSDAFREVSYLLKWFVREGYKTWFCAILFLIAVAFSSYPPLIAASVLGAVVALLILAVITLMRILGGADATTLSYAGMVKNISIVILFFSALPFVSLPDEFKYAILPTPLIDKSAPINAAALIAYCLLCAILVPLYPLFWRGLRLIMNRLGETAFGFRKLSLAAVWSEMKDLFRFLRSVAEKAAIGFGIPAIMILVKLFTPEWLLEWIQYIVTIVVIPVFLLGVVAAAAALVVFLLHLAADMKDIRRMAKNFRPERKSIADNIEKLRTRWGRLRYVNRLEELTLAHLDTLEQDDNLWPNGVRPQSGDKASMKLAQLDARWLGID